MHGSESGCIRYHGKINKTADFENDGPIPIARWLPLKSRWEQWEATARTVAKP
jgi:hypothetical protein